MYDPQVVKLDEIWEHIDQICKLTNLSTESLLNDVEPFTSRRLFAAFYSWAIPSKEAIEVIKIFANGEEIIEIGAGRGLWSAILQKEGCVVRALDLNFDAKPRAQYFYGEHEFLEIERLTEDKMLDVSKEAKVLFFCWPCYNKPWANQHLKNTKANKIVYIGEDIKGCNATDNFFNLLYNDFEHEFTINIPQWWGIHDRVELYRRKI
jgi:hypothetical protein